MEHRCSIRKQLAIQVLFYKHGLPVQSGLSRNLGLGGVFVEVNSLAWQKNEYIDIEFISACGVKLRLPALVIHYTKQGVGLMFDGLALEQRKVLRDILFATKQSKNFTVDSSKDQSDRQVA